MTKIIFLFIFNLCFSLNIMACTKCIELDANQGFIASSSIPFSKLMEDSMHLMDSRMNKIEYKGSNEKIFLEMMLAHHQGALNMAHSLLVHSKDKQITNFARSIISSQFNEVLYIQTLLKTYK